MNETEIVLDESEIIATVVINFNEEPEEEVFPEEGKLYVVPEDLASSTATLFPYMIISGQWDYAGSVEEGTVHAHMDKERGYQIGGPVYGKREGTVRTVYYLSDGQTKEELEEMFSTPESQRQAISGFLDWLLD